VQGLKGLFGRLQAGHWRFFSNHSGILFSIVFSVGPSADTIYYVDATAKGKNDGTSWTDAFNYLQYALAVAIDNCEIRIAQGVYRSDKGAGATHGDPNASFYLRTQVIIKGGYVGLRGTDPNYRDPKVYETVLSGDLQSNDTALTRLIDLFSHPSRTDNCYHVIVAEGPDTIAVLDGLTICGGNTTNDNAGRWYGGGGIYNDKGSLTITDCVFIRNSAWLYGGAIYNASGSSLKLTDCIISNSFAFLLGGAVYQGSSASLIADRCAISGNAVNRYGGAICCNAASGTSLSNCVLSGNSAISSTDGEGGAIYTSAGTVQVDNCTLTGNSAAAGSTIARYSPDSTIQNSIKFENCILWDEGSAVLNDANSAFTMRYCDVRGGWTGQGNINADPCFVEAGYWEYGAPADSYNDLWVDGDYHLLGTSPCTNRGDPCYVYEPGATDIAGNPRVTGGAVDIGAYESYELENKPPIAEAGPDQTGFALAGGTVNIILDGSGSSDPEGEPLRYIWFRSGKEIAQGSKVTVRLSPGEYTFELVVNDGRQNSTPDAMSVTVTKKTEAQYLQ
jgi:hypothetical protein